MQLLLYTRRGCHLCEAAEDLLAGLGAVVTLVDVDADPAARARFGLRVPVLVAGGRTLLEGRFEAAGLARALSEAEVEPAAGVCVDQAGG
jgi:glutaredoxin